MTYKYLILFPVPGAQAAAFRRLMDQVCEYTRTPAPYLKLCPHVTFHPPLVGIDGQIIKDIAQRMALQMKQARLRVSGLDHFGKEYIVMPVHATLALASFWVGITKMLSILSKHTQGVHVDDNTLHVTIAEHTSSVFDIVWPTMKLLSIDPIECAVQTIEVHRKAIGPRQAAWEQIAQYCIPL